MKPSLEYLGFMGNDDDGTFAEALRVSMEGRDHYVLCQGAPIGSVYQFRHKEFPTKDELMVAFPGCHREDWSTPSTDRPLGITDDMVVEAIGIFRDKKRAARSI